MSCVGDDQQRMIEAADPAVVPGEGARRKWGRPTVRGVECTPRRGGSEAAGSRSDVRGVVDSANGGRVVEARRAALALEAGEKALRSAGDSSVWWY